MADPARHAAPAACRPEPEVHKSTALAALAVPARLQAPANDDHPHLPERLAPDLPAAVGFFLVGAFAWTIGAYLIAFGGDRQALEMVVVDIVYVAIYLGVPWLVLRMEPQQGLNPTFAQFMGRGIMTFTGHLTGAEALVQILLIPVALAIAATAMCLVAIFA